MKNIVAALALILLLTAFTPTFAQELIPIEYGQTLTGEITNDQFEIAYTFTGTAGDVIVIEMAAVDILGDMHSPAILVLDANFRTLWNAEGAFSTATLVGELPADGQYTIGATRRDGQAGDSVGEFTLRLIKATVLNVDEPIQDTVVSTSPNYYAVRMPGAFTVAYEKSSGDFTPAVEINQIERSELTSVATLHGDRLTAGSITITPASSLAVETFVVTVSQAIFDFNFNPVTANYTLTLQQ